MNKKQVIQLFEEEITSITKNISILERLDPKKVYKISHHIYGSVKDEVTKENVWKVIESCSFIGKLKSFNKESLRFVAMGIQKVKGTRFEWDLRKQALKKDFEVSLKYSALDSIEEWENLETPQLEAAFLVNHEFISSEMKKRCFSY